MTECEVYDLGKLRKEKEKEETPELYLPIPMIRDLILKGYDPTSLEDIEKYVFIHDAIDRMMLGYEDDDND